MSGFFCFAFLLLLTVKDTEKCLSAMIKVQSEKIMETFEAPSPKATRDVTRRSAGEENEKAKLTPSSSAFTKTERGSNATVFSKRRK